MKKISVAGRKYKKQDGTEGTEWTTVGVSGVNTNGKEYVMLDPKICLAGLPIGENGMVMCGVFEEQQNNQNNQGGGQQQQAPQHQQQSPQGYNNQQSYQAPGTQTQFVNAQNQITDAQGQLILLNGQPQYAQQ